MGSGQLVKELTFECANEEHTAGADAKASSEMAYIGCGWSSDRDGWAGIVVALWMACTGANPVVVLVHLLADLPGPCISAVTRACMQLQRGHWVNLDTSFKICADGKEKHGVEMSVSMS